MYYCTAFVTFWATLSQNCATWVNKISIVFFLLTVLTVWSSSLDGSSKTSEDVGERRSNTAITVGLFYPYSTYSFVWDRRCPFLFFINGLLRLVQPSEEFHSCQVTSLHLLCWCFHFTLYTFFFFFFSGSLYCNWSKLTCLVTCFILLCVPYHPLCHAVFQCSRMSFSFSGFLLFSKWFGKLVTQLKENSCKDVPWADV